MKVVLELYHSIQNTHTHTHEGSIVTLVTLTNRLYHIGSLISMQRKLKLHFAPKSMFKSQFFKYLHVSVYTIKHFMLKHLLTVIDNHLLAYQPMYSEIIASYMISSTLSVQHLIYIMYISAQNYATLRPTKKHARGMVGACYI